MNMVKRSDLPEFSYRSREAHLNKLENEDFDLVIIGGGITGAGISLDAACRGLKTALVEKDDFASGTSSRSTKLIHGGLRYLRQFQFHIVAETGRERKIVHQLAPHLVIPEKMVLPIMKGAAEGKWLVSIGLWLYDLLAGVSGNDRKKMLNVRQTQELEPLLSTQGITGSGFYAEYRTDDARLTTEVIKTACRHGAVCLNYLAATDFLYENNKISGVLCQDKLSGRKIKISGKVVVNATGPWVDDLRKKNGSLSGKHLYLTKGIHLVFPREKIPLKHALYFEIPDGRMIFLIPRENTTYVGTTDTHYTGDKEKVNAEPEDIQYLLDAFNHLFPDLHIGAGDIISTWAGLRPLIYEEGKSASEISRKDEIFVSPTGLISMAGGKLTGYRKMAVKVVNRVARQLNRRGASFPVKSRTRHIPLTQDGFKDYSEVQAYSRDLEQELHRRGIPDSYRGHLVHNFGPATRQILEKYDSLKDSDPEKKLLKAEIQYCIDHEMVVKPLDYLERRSGRIYFMPETVRKYVDAVMDEFGVLMDWDKSRKKEEKRVVLNRLDELTTPAARLLNPSEDNKK